MNKNIIAAIIAGLTLIVVILAVILTVETNNVREDRIDAETSVNQETEEETEVAEDQEQEELAETSVSPYEQWAIQIEDIPYLNGDLNGLHYYFGDNSIDCLGMVHGDNYDGDLLSTLIANETIRNELNLSVYSDPNYVAGVESKVAAQTKLQNDSDFYAISICHLGNGVDVTAGYLWPSGQAYSHDDSLRTGTVAVVENGRVRLANNVQIMNNTATGGETYPCEPVLGESGVDWMCFQGLDTTQEVTGSRMKVWSIPFDGSAVTVDEYSEFYR